MFCMNDKVERQSKGAGMEMCKDDTDNFERYFASLHVTDKSSSGQIFLFLSG